MKTAIDAAGRVVVPKVLRDELGFEPGLALEIHARDGALVIEPIPTAVKLVRRGKVMVAKPTVRLPELTREEVRAALEGSRR
ncbi:MAG: antitoxin [Deltaproteobacteria bacterium]|nr:MAG: antitoxin [Deltaproteobacteria bacterium]